MAIAAVASLVAASPGTLPINEALSGIFGSISLTAWICLLLPQLLTNYRAQSAEGLSMALLFLWLFGDLTNLLGALLVRLAPTAIALATYFCISDLVLILQSFYYNALSARRAANQGEDRSSEDSDDPDEDSPLLSRRSFDAHRRQDARAESVPEQAQKIAEQVDGSGTLLYNATSILAVCLVGTVGWFISYRMGAWEAGPPSPEDPVSKNPSATESFGVFLGYCSSLFYLIARLPQIYKNYRGKSCEGLSLLFFLLAVVGNLMLTLSLLVYSQEPAYVLNSIPWLLGSSGTIAEDLVIFIQFRMYKK